MRRLSPEIWEKRADFLREIRGFFQERKLLEVETPLVNATGSVEAHLDSLRVLHSIRKSPEADETTRRDGYLITSPEHRLKQALVHLRRDLFQIAHSFRDGDIGTLHTEEFLMLEWYRVEWDEFALMDDVAALLAHLGFEDSSPPRLRLAHLMEEQTGLADWSSASLDRALSRNGIRSEGDWGYDDRFFALFLNRVEPTLPDGPCFVYGYPRELAAFSQVEGNEARRFEFYFDRIEIANGYYELRNAREYRDAFEAQNGHRIELGKPVMPPDLELLSEMEEFERSHHGESALPECSGVALGLDRLFMLWMGEQGLSAVSPF